MLIGFEQVSVQKNLAIDPHYKLLHASTGASSVGVISGISTIGTTFIIHCRSNTSKCVIRRC